MNGQNTSITMKTVNSEVENKTVLVKGMKVPSSRYEDWASQNI